MEPALQRVLASPRLLVDSEEPGLVHFVKLQVVPEAALCLVVYEREGIHQHEVIEPHQRTVLHEFSIKAEHTSAADSPYSSIKPRS